MNRIIIVGASAAGLSAAEALRRAGFTGTLTLIGEEPDAPYDRPPLSKQILASQWEPDGLPCGRSTPIFAWVSRPPVSLRVHERCRRGAGRDRIAAGPGSLYTTGTDLLVDGGQAAWLRFHRKD